MYIYTCIYIKSRAMHYVITAKPRHQFSLPSLPDFGSPHAGLDSDSLACTVNLYWPATCCGAWECHHLNAGRFQTTSTGFQMFSMQFVPLPVPIHHWIILNQIKIKLVAAPVGMGVSSNRFNRWCSAKKTLLRPTDRVALFEFGEMDVGHYNQHNPFSVPKPHPAAERRRRHSKVRAILHMKTNWKTHHQHGSPAWEVGH